MKFLNFTEEHSKIIFIILGCMAIAALALCVIYYGCDLIIRAENYLKNLPKVITH